MLAINLRWLCRSAASPLQGADSERESSSRTRHESSAISRTIIIRGRWPARLRAFNGLQVSSISTMSLTYDELLRHHISCAELLGFGSLQLSHRCGLASNHSSAMFPAVHFNRSYLRFRSLPGKNPLRNASYKLWRPRCSRTGGIRG